MLTAIFRRCLNLTGPPFAHEKNGRQVPLPRNLKASYFIAKEAVRAIGTMYPPPPERGQE